MRGVGRSGFLFRLSFSVVCKSQHLLLNIAIVKPVNECSVAQDRMKLRPRGS